MMIEPYLEDLENRIDPEAEERLLADWRQFIDGHFNGDIFSPHRSHPIPPGIVWPEILINDALDDPELMLLRELALCSAMLADRSGSIMAVRANYGSSILPSLFGPELFIMERHMNTLPTSRPLPGGAKAIQRLLGQGVPSLTGGLGGKVFEMTRFYLDQFKDYPKISRYVHLYHPDAQGPMDVCEVLWGSTLFNAVYDEPEIVKDFLNLITKTYTAFLRAWFESVPVSRPYAAHSNAAQCYAVHWSYLHKGAITLRDDSAMNFSPRMFEEFIAPYDQRLLDEFGGGMVHFCGRGDHYIDILTQMEGVNAIQLSQPAYNRMEKIYQYTVDQGIPLIGLEIKAAEEAVKAGRGLHPFGRVHAA
jgi:hypothetical protein